MMLSENEYLEMDYHVDKEYGVYKIRSVAKEKSKDGHKLYVGVCQVCGFKRIAKLSDFKAPSANRCTHQDSFAQMTEVQFEIWYEENKRICLNCHRPVPLKKTDKKSDYLTRKFCSKSCAASYNNRGGSLINPEDVQNLGQDCLNEAENFDDIDYPVGKTYGIFKILSREPERDPKYNKVLYRCICLDCGIEKVAPLHRIKEYVDHCTHVGKLSELPKERFEIWYENNKVKCQKCGKNIPAKDSYTKGEYLKRKFCDECYTRLNPTKKGSLKYYCEFCGKEIKAGNRFCDSKCQQDSEYQSYISRWKTGLESGSTGSGEISGHVKRYIKEKFDYKCVLCGWSEANPVTQNISVEVHHVDGNFTNNVEENLTLLCPCCHSLTPNYRGLNNGNGRYVNPEQSSKTGIDDPYIGETFGIYTTTESFIDSNGHRKYKGICNECGFEKVAIISKFKELVFNCRHVNKKGKKRIRHYFRLSEMPKDEFELWYEENKKQCLNCGTDIPICSSEGKSQYKIKKFCSSACLTAFNYKTYIEKWKSGLETGISGKIFLSEHIRKYIFKKFQNKCFCCGWDKINPYTNRSPLEIHHIDGNFKNNNEDNLTLLCPNCHSLTPNYKALNTGKGRQRNKK